MAELTGYRICCCDEGRCEGCNSVVVFTETPEEALAKARGQVQEVEAAQAYAEKHATRDAA